jgi:hypothetical protein
VEERGRKRGRAGMEQVLGGKIEEESGWNRTLGGTMLRLGGGGCIKQTIDPRGWNLMELKRTKCKRLE